MTEEEIALIAFNFTIITLAISWIILAFIGG